MTGASGSSMGMLRTKGPDQWIVPMLWGLLVSITSAWASDSPVKLTAAWVVMAVFSRFTTFGPWGNPDGREQTARATSGIRSKRWFQIMISVIPAMVEAGMVVWMAKNWSDLISHWWGALAGGILVALLFRGRALMQRATDRDLERRGICPRCRGSLANVLPGDPCPACGRQRSIAGDQPIGRPICARCGRDMTGREEGRTCPDCGAMYGIEYVQA